jgi:hypothetical protein
MKLYNTSIVGEEFRFILYLTNETKTKLNVMKHQNEIMHWSGVSKYYKILYDFALLKTTK